MKTQPRFAPIILIGIFFQSVAANLNAQGTAFIYQGRLDISGVPFTGSAEFQPTLWNSLSSGAAVATNSPPNVIVPVTNGLFSLPLDFGVSPFAAGFERWLQLEVRTTIGPFTTLSPRRQLTPTPYAITASNLSGTLPASRLTGTLPAALFSGTYTGAVAFNNLANSFSGNAAGLTNVNAATLGGVSASGVWQLGGNNVSGGQFLGSTNNQPLEFKVNGTRALRLETTVNGPNIVGGNANNISGGGANNVIGGGESQTIIGVYGNSVIVGGYANLIGGTHVGGFSAFGGVNAIGGGVANNIQTNVSFSTIAGGEGNRVLTNASWAAIGGGYRNDIGLGALYATIPGGRDNDAAGHYSFAAGRRAKAMNDGAFVWADSQNADFTSTANNQFLVRASGGVGIGTTIPEEQLHVEDSSSAGLTYPLKISNEFPATQGTTVGVLFQSDDGPNRGKGALVYERTTTWNRGSFHFLQNSAADSSLATNTHAVMTILNDGRVGIGNTNPTNKLHVMGGATFASGSGGANQAVVWIPGSASWSFTSDRNSKDRIEPVDPQAVLDKVAHLPLAKWSYIGYDQRHLGPMAQDFHAAFPFSGDATTLNSADLDGVALAAIQGLNQKLEASLERKEKEIAELRLRLEKLERLFDKNATGEGN